MSRENTDIAPKYYDFLNRFVFYYGKSIKSERKIGIWISSDDIVYFGIVFHFWSFRVSFWMHREKI